MHGRLRQRQAPEVSGQDGLTFTGQATTRIACPLDGWPSLRKGVRQGMQLMALRTPPHGDAGAIGLLGSLTWARTRGVGLSGISRYKSPPEYSLQITKVIHGERPGGDTFRHTAPLLTRGGRPHGCDEADAAKNKLSLGLHIKLHAASSC